MHEDARPASGPENNGANPLRWRRGHLFALAVLLLSLALVAIAWNNARERELKLAEAQFHANVGTLASQVQQQINSYALTLRGGSSLFAALQWPSPQHWRSYADGLDLPTHFPSLTGLGFAAYVDQSQLSRLQIQINDAGNGRLTVRPHGVRAHYAPIIYLEPRTPENLAAIGYDMYSEPVRQAAMRAAMDSGEAQLSGVVQLVQDGATPVVGMLLYTPVYSIVPTPQAPAQRRSSLKGWVQAPFRVQSMVRTAISDLKTSERMRVVDVSDARHVVLYADHDIGEVNAFTHSVTKSLHGRRWRFDFFSGPQHAAAPQMSALNKLLAAGVVVSLLLFGLMWMLVGTQMRAQRIATDMTASFRRSEQRFRNALHYSAIGQVLLDTQGRIVEANPAFAEMAGLATETMLGSSLGDLFDGQQGDALRTSQMDIVVDDRDGVFRATRTLLRHGSELRHVQLTMAPVPGDSGRDIARLVQMEDVTERTRAEAAVKTLNRTLEARVAARTRELSEANSELESFAYSVSHDLRAPLRAIEGFSRILSERHAASLDAVGQDYLARVRKATARMADLIDAMLRLSRISRSGLAVSDVDLSAMALEVAAELAQTEPRRKVDIRIAPGMHTRGDRALLQTLLENLIGNAWKFTRDATDARIEVGMEPAEAVGAGRGGVVRYFVRDNGAGFDPAYIDKLFRPFQRLHSNDIFAGHGIGLASVKRILERHGGEASAEGKPGHGATFRFSLGDPKDDH